MPTSPLRQTAGTPAAEASREVLDLSVIIVNYNVREFLEQALRSVMRACADLAVEVFVVDNSSVDGSAEMVRLHFPSVHLIVNEENIGFARANNQAIRRARGRYLLLLNPDTIIQEDTLTTLVRFMEQHPEAGAAGCQILNPDGSFAPESRRAFPTPAVAFYRLIGLSRLLPKSRRFGRYNLTYLPRHEVAEVDALSGSCMLVRRAALYYARAAAAQRTAVTDARPEPAHTDNGAGGAGLLDESFFMYGEDLDWCYRIQQVGWKIYYTPDTQIIHYKGESTKKGELRYVRLFYGAMLQFAEKHFREEYGRLFARLLHIGVVIRAALSVLGSGLRRLVPPLLDFGLVYLLITLLGLGRSALAGAALSALFFASVAPAYALGTVAGIAVLGGYRPKRARSIRPVLAGATVGLLLVAASSFFIKDMAFSRAVVLLGFPLVVLVLAARRLLGRAQPAGPRRALLVGHLREARRLQHMLTGHPRPPFELVGYVEASPQPEEEVDTPGVPCLGPLHHLRDLVRLRRINDIVFATHGLSNRTIFDLMQRLRGLPVQFRMLAEDRPHLIGKAAVEDLALPSLLAVEEAAFAPRSAAARRAFEIPAALLGLLLHPFLWGLGRLTRRPSRARRLAQRTRQMPAVLSGRRALIGYHPEDRLRLPRSWGLRPGVFAVTDAQPVPPTDPPARRHIYCFYALNQSALLDLEILLRAIRNLGK